MIEQINNYFFSDLSIEQLLEFRDMIDARVEYLSINKAPEKKRYWVHIDYPEDNMHHVCATNEITKYEYELAEKAIRAKSNCIKKYIDYGYEHENLSDICALSITSDGINYQSGDCDGYNLFFQSLEAWKEFDNTFNTLRNMESIGYLTNLFNQLGEIIQNRQFDKVPILISNIDDKVFIEVGKGANRINDWIDKKEIYDYEDSLKLIDNFEGIYLDEDEAIVESVVDNNDFASMASFRYCLNGILNWINKGIIGNE
jgi:hypothetical protein